MLKIENETWLSTPEVTEALNISRSTLFSLRKSGNGPRNVKLGKCLYFNESALVQWLHDNEESA
jgi:predicted DNA-binding transcriptional regulator AlpA